MSFLDQLKVILIVLGLAKPYPDVNIKNIDVLQTPAGIVCTFTAHNIYNPKVNRLIEEKIPLIVEYRVMTYLHKKSVFSTNYTVFLDSLPYSEHFILIGKQVILPKHLAHSGHFLTRIKLYLSTPNYEDLRALWGNQPIVEVNYTLLQESRE